jgi:hypothetical protein
MWAKRVFVRLSRRSFIFKTTMSSSVVARPMYHLRFHLMITQER